MAASIRMRRSRAGASSANRPKAAIHSGEPSICTTAKSSRSASAPRVGGAGGANVMKTAVSPSNAKPRQPKVSSAQEIIAAAERLAVLEAARGEAAGRVRLLALVTETPAGLLALPQYPQVLGASAVTRAHLAGFTWGAEDLSAALGAGGKRDRTGALTFTFELARAHCLLAAAALDVQAVDGVNTEFRDAAALQRELEDARRDGFGGKLAIHPDQVAPINAAFSPTAAEREHAQRVLAAFAAAGNSGVASLDGQMIDRPHLLQAQRILAASKG